MKIDRHDPAAIRRPVKLRFTERIPRFFGVAALFVLLAHLGSANPPNSENQSTSDPKALALVDQVIDRLANGPAFYCKIRQQIRTGGLETGFAVDGVGSYQQVGNGTGQFNLHLDLHDGNGKHTLHQVSDGRLAWTRRKIADQIYLSRVNVVWLDEGARAQGMNDRVKPSMKVGGPSEMLDSIRRDYDLKLGKSTLNDQKLLVLIGNLKPERRSQIESQFDAPLPELFPTRVNVAIAQEDDPETGIGKGLPVRIEHFSDPIAVSANETGNASSGQAPSKPRRRMISMLEFYRIQPIQQPPIEQFQFKNQDTDIEFVNENSRYEQRFNIKVSAKERATFQ